MSTPETSIIKLFTSRMATEMAELTVAVQGPGAACSAGRPGARLSGSSSSSARPSLRIAAGSDEIQRNVIGERVLGLPHDVRVDNDLPFRDLIR